MARKTFFSKLTDYVLDKDEDEESAEDIDRRLEAEIAEIKSKKQEALEGSKVLKDDWSGEDDVVYMMDLGPLYAIIGGRTGMLGKRLPDACAIVFDRFVPAVEGRSRLRGDLFIMTFSYPSREEGFRKSAEVINEIGLQTLGERFKSIEIPDLLVAADAASLTGEDGGFDPSKAKAQMESGGIGCSLGEPRPDDPEWLKFSVKKASKVAELVETKKAAEAGKQGNTAAAAPGAKPAADTPRPRRRGDPDWADERSDRRVRISSDPSQMERRRGRDRRVNR